MPATTAENGDTEDTMEEQTQNDITKAIRTITNKAPIINRYIRYYDGLHRLNFAGEKFRLHFGKRLQKFRDNLMKIPVNAPSDRLRILGFAPVTGTDTGDPSIEATAIWKRSSMPKYIHGIHREVFKVSEAYVIVYLDANGAAKIYPQDSRNCAVWIDPETDLVELGAKMWRGTDTNKNENAFVFLTLYYPDRTEKYISKTRQAPGNFPTTAQGFKIREVVLPDGELEPHPLKNETGIVPMFEFRIEQSILDDLIPLNDALNKEVADLLVASEANSKRQRWSVGVQLERNEDGQAVIPWSDDDQYAYTSKGKETAAFGEFAQLSLTDFVNVVNDFRIEIARVSGIPLYYFMLDKGSFPSGEALSKAESRFTSIVEEAQDNFGDTWSKVMEFALLIDENPVDEETMLETQWLTAAPSSESTRTDIAIKKKSVGVSDRQNLKELGYTEDQIDEIEKEREAEAEARARAEGAFFDAGAGASGTI